MFPMTYIDIKETKLYFCELFLAHPFFICNGKNWNVSPKRLFQRERQSCERHAQLGTLVGLLLATTGLAASAKLELVSSALLSGCGLRRQPNCDPCWHGARALAPRVALEAIRAGSATPPQVALGGPQKRLIAVDDQRAAMWLPSSWGPTKACSRPQNSANLPSEGS